MIKIEHTTVTGWEAALRGMRNPLSSHDRSDTAWNTNTGLPIIGKNDMELARKLTSSFILPLAATSSSRQLLSGITSSSISSTIDNAFSL